MERTIKINSAESVDDLALKTEEAINELDSLRKRRGHMTYKPDNPEGGDSFYNEETDTVEIYNSKEGAWIAQ
jgi:hypothetical protein